MRNIIFHEHIFELSSLNGINGFKINGEASGDESGASVEYAGDVFKQMSMEGRMTVCNLSIEMGARGGMIAPDDKTFEYRSLILL